VSQSRQLLKIRQEYRQATGGQTPRPYSEYGRCGGSIEEQPGRSSMRRAAKTRAEVEMNTAPPDKQPQPMPTNLPKAFGLAVAGKSGLVPFSRMKSFAVRLLPIATPGVDGQLPCPARARAAINVQETSRNATLIC